MKKIIIVSVIIALVASSFTIAAEISNGSAEVEQVQGVYIFVHAKPSKSFEYLGTVSSPAVIKNYKASYLIDLMVKRAKEKHPTCNAVIFKNADLIEVEAVLIK